jgi:hypothetical protein
MNATLTHKKADCGEASDNGMEQSIQQRAYELYLNRGEQPGHEMEDWLQAEREIKERQRPKRAKKEPRQEVALERGR